ERMAGRRLRQRATRRSRHLPRHCHWPSQRRQAPDRDCFAHEPSRHSRPLGWPPLAGHETSAESSFVRERRGGPAFRPRLPPPIDPRRNSGRRCARCSAAATPDSGCGGTYVRVLCVTHYFAGHGGGIEMVAGRLVEELARRGVEVIWAATSIRGEAPQSLPEVRLLAMKGSNLVEKMSG